MVNPEELICAVLQGRLVDWRAENCCDQQDILGACRHHGVSALFYHALKDSGQQEYVPVELLDSLRKTVIYQVALEMHRIHELQTILKSCAEEGITPLLLKGTALAYTHYAVPTTRERCDTDLFIAFADIDKMQKVMARLGYMSRGSLYKSHQFTSTKTIGAFQMICDIHWRITNIARFARVLDYREAFEQAVMLPGTEISGARTLCPQHTLLLSCVHLAGTPDHDSDRLIWLYDIDLLVRSMNDADLEDFVRLAAEKGAGKVCLSALEKTQQSFATRASAQLCQRLSSLPQDDVAEHAIKNSNFGLLVHDLYVLPVSGKVYLLKELFCPSAEELLARNNKKSVFWLPFLYCRQVITGIVNRLLLR